MPSQAQKSASSASSRSSSSNSTPPDQLISLPSLACSLSALPQAKSIDGLSLHPSRIAQRNAESQAKLQKALSKSAANASLPAAYGVPHAQPVQYSPNSNSPPLMMRKSAKSKMQV
ncbi:hypothetical protein K466DRAFT_561746 [Polyporus arcularius HHB13444]|uniref:Uncharacterized protein n=1 Tax=Polyporus arcularius HHB13444 TaxID=1314778 RepID=A0A5C3PUS8_9APHY|nr:hypothetical protein K466DRAFT_561746 [Polyporus arcularius HHB13444]